MTKDVFTVEEKNLVHIFRAKTRKELIREISDFMDECGSYFRELSWNTIRKLSSCSDEAFHELMTYPAEIFETE
jgi:hypothetical protein